MDHQNHALESYRGSRELSAQVMPSTWIAGLKELASNLWWSWNWEALALYQAIDPELWEQVYHNPVKLLHQVEPGRLEAVAGDPAYLARYERVMAAFDAYMNCEQTWCSRNYPEWSGQVIAYFSAEFGLHECLPIYSGGLGILSGDHCKAASDLGLPLVGIGFLYPQGYFRQRINRWGEQEAFYEKLDLVEVPARLATTPSDEPVIVEIDLPGRRVCAKLWRIQVGRVPLFLMDTDVHPNAPEDRTLAARLYGGDEEMRISQEMILGIGGVRALRALGIQPVAWHMNEGHSAFAGLERVRQLVQEEGLTFGEACEVVRATTVFTTHTPVAAGHDAFPFHLMEKYFAGYWEQLGLNRDQFMDLGHHELPWGPRFSMTVLALKLSGRHNGVSELHGHISRAMWRGLWPNLPVAEVPIGHITNGIHTATWLAPEMTELFDTYLGDGWRQHLDDPALWERVHNIPDVDLWRTRRQLKRRMIEEVRRRVRARRERLGESPERIHAASSLLDPQALTIGFARRFATYKRATLIFRDPERLKGILNQPGRPVQIIFAGKAHPADDPGKALIRRIHELAEQSGFEGRIVFVEDYDIDIARHLVQGVDLWLNNPRRPLEASGTSGQKAALNGALNLSVLDGWWREAYNGTNGWAIGEAADSLDAEPQWDTDTVGKGWLHHDSDEQDAADAQSLYEVLENEIVPLFYDQDEEGIPHGWLGVVKESIRTVAPAFTTWRMVKDYAAQMYRPAARASHRRPGDVPATRIRGRECAASEQGIDALLEGFDLVTGQQPL